jgi:tetratricopeptide (TPR) repeat protein
VFVGRDREIAELCAGLAAADASMGCLFVLGGEPGIGKSRLADEVAERASQDGFRVVWGRCWEAGGAPAYWPWVQAIRAYVHDIGIEDLRRELGAGASVVAQVVAEVANAFPDLTPPAPSEAEAGRFRLFDAITTFLRNASVRRPLMIILDDLHAADIPSLLLLQFVARQLGDSRLFILGAYRSVELRRDHPLTLALAELSRETSTSHVPLFGLSESEVALMMEQTIGARPSGGVIAAVHRETEGNPLFVTEVVRLLSAEGGLEGAGDAAAIRMAIPAGVRDVIERRIGRLSDGCRQVLIVASVFGREFAVEGVGALSDRPTHQVFDVLDEAVAAGVVDRVAGSPGRLRFAHALIRDALYDGIGLGHRLDLHRAAGETLEALYRPNVEAHLAELAHHFFEAVPAGGATKAIDYAEAAGHRACVLLAYEEAIRLFRMALTALDAVRVSDEARRCRLLLALGDALDRAGERDTAKEELVRAADVARTEGLAEELGWAALGYGGRFIFCRGASDARMLPLLEDARVALSDDNGPVRARVLARLAAAMRDQPDRTPRDELSRQAVEVARSLDDPPALAYALLARAAAMIGPDDSEGQLAALREQRAAAQEARDKELEVEGLGLGNSALLHLGRIGEYAEAIETMGRLADELRQPAQRWIALMQKASLALLEGRLVDAEELVESGLRWGVHSHPFDAIGFYRVQLFALRREQGRLAELEQDIRASVAEYPTRPIFRCVLACLLAELGETNAARSVFKPSADCRFVDLPLNNDLLLSLAYMVEAASNLREDGAAAALYDLLLPYQGHVVDTTESSAGAVDRYLGLAAWTADRLDVAAGHLNAALELNSHLGAQPWVVRTHRDLAILLSIRDGPGDRQMAADHARAALGVAERLGMTALAVRIRDDLSSLGTPLPGTSADVGPAQSEGALFVREGEYWSIALGGEAFRLKDSRGLRYLAELLRSPGREFHVLELANVEHGVTSKHETPRPLLSDDLYGGGSGDIGPVLDDQAKSTYRARLRDLQEELNEATEWADDTRAAQIREEMDFLTRELAAALGLGGRNRKMGSPAERARVNITRAIRSALSRIREHSPAIADHLDATIHTGTFCSYTPDPRAPVSWQA